MKEDLKNINKKIYKKNFVNFILNNNNNKKKGIQNQLNLKI